MAGHEKVFVICENKCFEEGMTKEQILAAVTAGSEAIIDPVTQTRYKIRVLTKSEYDALDGHYAQNTIYYVVDEEFASDSVKSHLRMVTTEAPLVNLTTSYQKFNREIAFNNVNVICILHFGVILSPSNFFSIQTMVKVPNVGEVVVPIMSGEKNVIAVHIQRDMNDNKLMLKLGDTVQGTFQFTGFECVRLTPIE